MANKSYNRSRKREYQVLHEYEEAGWLAFRTAGSHGVADIIAVRIPKNVCSDPSHLEIKLLQIKTSKKVKRYHHTPVATETRIGDLNIDYLIFPSNPRKEVKSK